MTSRVGRMGIVVLLLAAACASETSPSATGARSPSPTPSVCVGETVPISFPCPLSEVGSTPTDLTGRGDAVTLTMDAGEGAFEPTFVKTRPGARVTLQVRGGIFGHVFVIDGLVPATGIPASKTTTVSFTLPSTGPVIFYCPPHRRYGMQGAFYFV